jgi:hypothetical protein
MNRLIPLDVTTIRLLISTQRVSVEDLVNCSGPITCSTTSSIVGINRESKNLEVTAISIISESVAQEYKTIEVGFVAEALIFKRVIAADLMTSHTLIRIVIFFTILRV